MRYSSYLLPVALVVVIVLVLFSMITGRALDHRGSPVPTPAVQPLSRSSVQQPAPVSAPRESLIDALAAEVIGLGSPGCLLVRSANGRGGGEQISTVCLAESPWYERREDGGEPWPGGMAPPSPWHDLEQALDYNHAGPRCGPERPC